ncbi:hypothetical protein A3D77_06630 [Candidatus Gottesmanbacteria bacterium RIFCSPHIGHO2_02_FULL_39_11]|uniref:Bacterial repeat domain-containing protein n=1 Tax=Candidatus Gottesmanbacteria bacterium RIFCSPHIGHO2_02_FULL_39_11 TaxID=1798382 RepID=A0A1F5ZT20_9BACT|nr:MAG: hypothetical protein A3D77_06630 [Candidatus Gottesmanbacteria bacterium RIFCSPHIGHO2_02_FULL_39_11]
MKKNQLPILFFIFFIAVAVRPPTAFAQVGLQGPPCPDSAFTIPQQTVQVGDWVNFVSGCQNQVGDEVTGGFDINANISHDVLANSNPIQGQVANQSGRGLGIDRANRCINGVNSDNYKAATAGQFAWYHGWGCTEHANWQQCTCVNSTNFTIVSNGVPAPSATLAVGPTSSVPTSTAPTAVPSATPAILPSDTPYPLPPTLAPLPNCLDQIGSISFKKPDSSIGTFAVYSKTSAPQTFLLKSPDDPNTYVYAVTNASYPQYKPRNSTLQLGNLPFITKNAWTWATPWCKPAIYLYPEEPTDLNVKLAVDGKITVSDPVYDAVNGWNVHAEPNGTLSSLTFNLKPNTYSYLYYEADLNNVEIPKNGFVIPQMNLGSELSAILTTLGFNSTEKNDFLKYWLPRLTDRPYYFVTLLPENVINEKETLSISNLEPTTYNLQPITPDSMIRSRFVFEGLDTPVKVDPLTIPSHPREGFTLTDWGGTIVGKSCTDITVK